MTYEEVTIDGHRLRGVYLRWSCPDLGQPYQQEWEDWLDAMGLNLNRIPLGTELICDDTDRRIYYTNYVTDDDGKVQVSPEGTHVMTERLFMQLEAPALPLPGGQEHYWSESHE